MNTSKESAPSREEFFTGQRQSFSDAQKRAEALLAEMTLDEKIEMLSGYKGFYIRGLNRLNIPCIKMSDGPVGTRNDGRATAFPASIALAASWDPMCARRVGVALGRECRARGVHILLAPGVNIYRQPQCGRNFEYLGEDPHLASLQSSAYILGLQRMGVMATIKHYAANSQDHDRHHTSSDMDERTLREIYLPAFRMAIQQAGVSCVMTAYNLVNGVHCSEHAKLNNEILRDEWGFKGIVMSDWNSVYSTAGPVNGGLDIEMPSGKFMNCEAIKPLLADGTISEATIDEKIRRLLRTCIAMGFFDREQRDDGISWDDGESRETALNAARQGMVLLKNERALPLDRQKCKHIAVVGPNAHPAVKGGGGSSRTLPFRETSILEGIRSSTGEDLNITHIPFAAVGRIEDLADASRFTTKNADGFTVPGMRASYFAGTDMSGSPVTTRVDARLNLNFERGHLPEGCDPQNFAVRWTGTIEPTQSGWHQFAASVTGTLRIWLDDEKIVDDSASGTPARLAQTLCELTSGQTYNLTIDLIQQEPGAAIQFSWHYLDLPAVAQADAVIACIGFCGETEREAFDRPFELPPGQPELLKLLTEHNERVIAVAHAGGAFATEGWLEKCSALLHAWYGGQDGGQAVADILFGDTNPSGKLPISFEKRWEDSAAFGTYPPTNGHMEYKEGVFVGYRHFDKNEIAPLFPFGYGLSYTSVEYSNLQQSTDSLTTGESVTFSVDVTNTGERAGAEVVQLYTEHSNCSIPRPPKELRAFAKTELQPGETETIELTVQASDLCFFHPENQEWTLEAGKLPVAIGASSRDIRMRAEVEIR